MRIVGRWQITESELWDSDALKLVAPAFIEFEQDGLGSFGFIAVQGRWTAARRSGTGRPGVKFSWRATMSAIRPGPRLDGAGRGRIPERAHLLPSGRRLRLQPAGTRAVQCPPKLTVSSPGSADESDTRRFNDTTDLVSLMRPALA